MVRPFVVLMLHSAATSASADGGWQALRGPRGYATNEDSGSSLPVEQDNNTEVKPPNCLCVFDIDRTLTGKQSDTSLCPRNQVLGMFDAGYGGGNATLSALSAAGISTTFCNECYLGITSAGDGSGEASRWNRYIMDHIMRGEQQDTFTSEYPDCKKWSHGTSVVSPYVLGQGNKLKQNAVELIRRWYSEPPRGISIEPSSVYFFGDRTENILPFKQKDLNSREISCASRDPVLYNGSGMVGYCGATPEEIQRQTGNILCA